MCKIAMVLCWSLRPFTSCFPGYRHLFADSVYNGPNLREALAKFGKWTIEIVKTRR